MCVVRSAYRCGHWIARRRFELLVDRLTASTPNFDPSDDTGPLDELCQRLDGVPLALELAAAQCRTLTPSELLVRLARRPEVLADRAGLFDERHRDP